MKLFHSSFPPSAYSITSTFMTSLNSNSSGLGMGHFNYHLYGPHIQNEAWKMLPLHIHTCSFPEKRMRHKELLSHCATPKYLKLETDAVPQGKVGLFKQSFHQQPEKPRGKFSHPKQFLVMFKHLKKSLHYVLMFPSLLVIFLTTCHPRMRKVPLDPSVLLPRHSLPAAMRGEHCWGETGLLHCFPQSTATLKIEIWQWDHLSCVLPENASHSILPSDEVCTGLARFFQKSGSSSAFS